MFSARHPVSGCVDFCRIAYSGLKGRITNGWPISTQPSITPTCSSGWFRPTDAHRLLDGGHLRGKLVLIV
ncbi:hypothetical protein [Microbispora rosea]|uniref:hypothetical protein n=1 Tax=Microbispora rosea TaxID=58117 RepID=UPI0034172655